MNRIRRSPKSKARWSSMALIMAWLAFLGFNTINLGSQHIPKHHNKSWSLLNVQLAREATSLYWFSHKLNNYLEVGCNNQQSDEPIVSDKPFSLIPTFFPPCRNITFWSPKQPSDITQMRFYDADGRGLDPERVCVDQICHETDQLGLFDQGEQMDELVKSRSLYFSSLVFDEVISLASATQLAKGILPNIARSHPIGGRWLLGQYLSLVEYSPFQLRLFSLFWASLLPVMGYLILWTLSRSFVAAWSGFGFVAINPLVLSLGRIGLLDTMLAFWVLAAIYFSLLASRGSTRKGFAAMLCLAGLALGIAGSIKISGLMAVIALCGWLGLSTTKHFQGLERNSRLLFLAIFPLTTSIIYTLHFRLVDDQQSGMVERAWTYSTTMISRHIHHDTLKLSSSHPLEWLLGRGGVGLFVDVKSSELNLGSILPLGALSLVLGIGTIFWLKLNRFQNLLLPGLFLILFCPWFIVPRQIYIYHFAPASLMLCLMTAAAFPQIIQKSRRLALSMAFVALVNCIAFSPAIYRISMPKTLGEHYLDWLKVAVRFNGANVSDR